MDIVVVYTNLLKADCETSFPNLYKSGTMHAYMHIYNVESLMAIIPIICLSKQWITVRFSPQGIANNSYHGNVSGEIYSYWNEWLGYGSINGQFHKCQSWSFITVHGQF